MKYILSLNCGSSTIKADIFEYPDFKSIISIRADQLLTDSPTLDWNKESISLNQIQGFHSVLTFILEKIKSSVAKIDCIGHRVVHGGKKFREPILITNEIRNEIEKLSELAPLHNPVALEGIDICTSNFPQVKQIAVFDTSFFQNMPSFARTYAVPEEWYEKYGMQKFGFHGTSHDFVTQRAAQFLKSDRRQLRMISCHLGSGASVAAVQFGVAIDTSMGMTTLPGLVMSTRSGDVDFQAVIEIGNKEGLSTADLLKKLNKESGLKGISGTADMREIESRMQNGDPKATLAFQIFCHRLTQYIGSFAAIMGGVDVLVFTGGIGENSVLVRNQVCKKLEFMGALMDEQQNQNLKLSNQNPVSAFSLPFSRVQLLAVATDEQLAIAQHSLSLIQKAPIEKPSIPIAISARHIHLSQESIEKLFGVGYELTVLKPLSQPGQFAANETLTIIGPKRQIEKVRILGPARKSDQVEISRTDEIYLGLDAPVRESGQTKDSPGITLVGPKGEVHLKEGVICAWRHIHMHPTDAEKFEVNDRDLVSVEVQSGEKSLIFNNVLIRVSESFVLEMHIDTDEGNAAEIECKKPDELQSTKSIGRIVKIS